MLHKNDLQIVYTRGSGPGGQHKNKVETCVKITHTPTGITTVCQATRSKGQNLKIALSTLEIKIREYYKKEKEKRKKEERARRINEVKVVRTYNYMRNQVYDHRRKARYNLKKFMKGEINLEF